MSWSATEVVDVVFVPIYFLLVPFIVFDVIKHKKKTRGVYVILLIFALLRTSSNALLVAGYEKSKDVNPSISMITSLFEAGFIMQSIGYGFLIGAALRFYSRAVSSDGNEQHLFGGQNASRSGLIHRLQKPSGLANIINIVAIILLAVGLSNSSSAYSDTPGGSVSDTAKAGSYLYCFLTALIMAMCIYHLFMLKESISNTSKTILIFILAASIPMAMRAGYTAYRIQTNSLVRYNVWLHMVFQYIVEVVAVIIFVILGFILPRIADEDQRILRRASEQTYVEGNSESFPKVIIHNS